MSGARREDITGVVLAGGRGSRLGGADKGLVEVDGRPLIEHVLRAFEPQVGAVFINANRNLETYESYGHRVIHDDMDDYQGPLAGIAAALAACPTPYLVTVPCDGPRLPEDLVSRLARVLDEEEAEIAVATDGRRMQPVYALIAVALEPDLRAFLDGGDRKIDRWYARHRTAVADFSDAAGTFANINTEADRRRFTSPGGPA